MNNADMESMPVGISRGLTKREYFAGIIMQGAISGFLGSNNPVKGSEVASFAVAAADTLLKELEK